MIRKPVFPAQHLRVKTTKAIGWACALSLLVVTVLLPVTNAAYAQDQSDLRFDIPSQMLSSALIAFGEAANLQVLYSAEVVQGLRTNGISGTYTLDRALQILLEGTGVTYRFTDAKTVTLTRVADPAEGKPEGSKSKITTLSGVLVEDTTSTSLTSHSTSEAQRELKSVPGGTTVIDDEQIRGHVQQNVQDVLDASPGVYAQSFSSTTPEALISIRGSGLLQNGAIISGIRLLLDGLPITHPMGYGQVEQVDLLNIGHVDIYRGAQALEYGAASLGGAINFVSPTGYTANHLRVGLLAGSDSYYRPYLSSGGVAGSGFDYFVSASGLFSEGFRDGHDDTSNTAYVNANLGYRWNAKNETRAYFSFAKLREGIPGPLTQQELEENPKQVTSPAAPDSELRSPFLRGALKHTIALREHDRLDLGAYAQLQNEYEFDELGIFYDFRERIADGGFSLRHEIHTPAWGRDNRVVWGILYNKGNDKEYNYFTSPSPDGPGPLSLQQNFDAENLEFFIQDQLPLTDTLTLVPGLQATRATREQHDVFNDFGAPNADYEETYIGVSPKLGLVWQASNTVQWFGNISRSFEPPIAGFGANFVSFDPITFAPIILDAQYATTLEVGTRGHTPRFNWELALYHALVTDELLTTQPDPNVPDFLNGNGDTLHSGVELGIGAIQPLGVSGQFREQVNYTYNRFRFDNDPSFGSNTLPLIPEHFGNVEVLYEHPSGFYVGPNLTVASKVFLDFTNSLEAKSYAILGARAGYKRPHGVSIFIEAQNLTDEAYTNRVQVTADAGGVDQQRFFPGLTRSVFAGAEVKF